MSLDLELSLPIHSHSIPLHPTPSMRVLIAGTGYLGVALGSRLVAAGHTVDALRRPGSDTTGLRQAGLQPLAADLTRTDSLAALPAIPWDWVVLCAAPAESTEPAYRSVYLDGTRNLLHRLDSTPPHALVFTGSTSVYGQTDGSDVDETSPTDPNDFGGRVLLETEALLIDSVRRGFPASIVRAAGIYGPGRHRLDAFRRGESRVRGDGSRWMNLIHRDDLAAAIVALLERAQPGAIYNACDGASPTEAEFNTWLAKQLRLPNPPPAPSGAGPPGRRIRTPTNKRVLARRLREELGWTPAYPDFRAGYESLLIGAPPGACRSRD
ncbi:MAG: SDR family oxidoreductase [Planctomycetota bacterium]|nr:SDR family oxidoreductase [Planctomycetota bacterium]